MRYWLMNFGVWPEMSIIVISHTDVFAITFSHSDVFASYVCSLQLLRFHLVCAIHILKYNDSIGGVSYNSHSSPIHIVTYFMFNDFRLSKEKILTRTTYRHKI